MAFDRTGKTEARRSIRSDNAADEPDGPAATHYLASGFNQCTLLAAGQELAGKGNSDAVSVARVAIMGDREKGKIRKGHETSAMDRSTRVHMPAFRPEGRHGSGFVNPEVEGACRFSLERLIIPIGPTGKFAVLHRLP